MNNLITKIIWNLNDYCESECSYCPITLRGGAEPPETKDYIRVANLIIENYSKMNRSIDWVFNGGEPLDMNDIVILLKLCRSNGNSMELNTNGGKLWMDWWAIEPYVDKLNLTYHYWQNPALIKYIIETFQEKNKIFNVSVPIRPTNFEEDMDRIKSIETNHKIKVSKHILYKNATQDAGMFNYTRDQLYIISGITPPKPAPPRPQPPPPVIKPSTPDIIEPIKPPPASKVESIIPPKEAPALVHEKFELDTVSVNDRYNKLYDSNPSFSGQLCNVGIEHLIITHQGWVKGSHCNNQPLGNIWDAGWMPPTGPQVCTMRACINREDQHITKFPN